MFCLSRASWISPIITSFILCLTFSPALPWIFPWAPSSSLLASPSATAAPPVETYSRSVINSPVSKEMQPLEFNADVLEANASMMPISQQNSLNQSIGALPIRADSTITMGVGTAIVIALLLIIFL